jgi:biopolymer transport protein ExbB
MLDLSELSQRAEVLLDQGAAVWREAQVIWVAGGWGMIAIAIDALVLFAIGVHIWLAFREKRFLSVPEKKWRRWIEHPEERRGPVGKLLDFAGGNPSLESTAASFQGLRSIEIAPFDRNLKVMKICVGLAPLLGLFGTVTGMLATFGALAEGSGGEQTMGMIASGISVALITTETGLVIALPGLFFHYQLARKHERYKAFLAHLESVCMQSLYRRSRGVEATV